MAIASGAGECEPGQRRAGWAQAAGDRPRGLGLCDLGWLGEAEGLKVSLAAAHQNSPSSMISPGGAAIHFGKPGFPDIAGRTATTTPTWSTHESRLAFQRGHQRHRLGEPAGLPSPPRPGRRARPALAIQQHQGMTIRLGPYGHRRSRHTVIVYPKPPASQATHRVRALSLRETEGGDGPGGVSCRPASALRGRGEPREAEHSSRRIQRVWPP
jgi:hypothetical protein